MMAGRGERAHRRALRGQSALAAPEFGVAGEDGRPLVGLEPFHARREAVPDHCDHAEGEFESSATVVVRSVVRAPERNDPVVTREDLTDLHPPVRPGREKRLPERTQAVLAHLLPAEGAVVDHYPVGRDPFQEAIDVACWPAAGELGHPTLRRAVAQRALPTTEFGE